MHYSYTVLSLPLPPIINVTQLWQRPWRQNADISSRLPVLPFRPHPTPTPHIV